MYIEGDMLRKIKSLIDPLLHFVYPELCIACDVRHPVQGSGFCIECISELPFTSFHTECENIVDKHFWGRVKIEKATALLYFQKGELVQEMLHKLKYKNDKKVGQVLGRRFGVELVEANFLEDIDVLIPVPIHKSKLAKRHYNQSEVLADAISEIANIPVENKIIVKAKNTSSQTDKSRANRLENLLGSFQLIDTEKVKGKHVLIIDDVLTTGATVEAVAQLLAEVTDRISVAVVAVGKY